MTLGSPMPGLGEPDGERGSKTRKVRILLAEMPRMLIDIIKGIIATQRDFVVVGEISVQDGLLRTAIDKRVDVIIVSALTTNKTENYSDLLYRRQRMKIIAIAADGRQALLHVLQPHAIPVGEVSAASLIAAIRGTSPADSGAIAP